MSARFVDQIDERGFAEDAITDEQQVVLTREEWGAVREVLLAVPSALNAVPLIVEANRDGLGNAIKALRKVHGALDELVRTPSTLDVTYVEGEWFVQSKDFEDPEAADEEYRRLRVLTDTKRFRNVRIVVTRTSVEQVAP